MTTFKHAIALCGLSKPEAAEFFQVSEDTIKDWCNEKRGANPGPGIWREMASLWRQIEDACDGASSEIEAGSVDRTYLNNIEADIIGNELPFEGCRKAAGAMALLVTIAEME